ncbi:MAG: acetate kinase [Bacteroidetes bacterium]|nr:MAG: acetate kinase [Bacteroidota bacterium]
MIILVLNCGSSSIKYQLLNMDNNANVRASGIIEKIGLPDSSLTHKKQGDDKYQVQKQITNHTDGINLILDTLVSKEHGVISELSEINAVGHRVAHGGENFKKSVLVNEDVKHDIEQCIELAPLHNPANLKGILAMEKILPGVPEIAVFDTSFHQTMPAYSYLYGIPYELYEKYKIRRYGFHGTSHKYVAQKACGILNLDFNNSKIITCHLGNGASVAAIKNGKSLDTSMGFTPVEGLMMGTRSGDLDIGILLFLAEKEDLSIKATNDLFNKKSGVAGVSGVSSDMRDIENAIAEGNERAAVALEMYAYRVKKYIGSYAAAMGGVDLIIFTGGIGENDDEVRRKSCEGLEFLGVDFNEEVNAVTRSKDVVLTKEGSKVTVMTVTTNEELVIATDTMNIVNNHS